jgi:hypothetical protein
MHGVDTVIMVSASVVLYLGLIHSNSAPLKRSLKLVQKIAWLAAQHDAVI